MNDNPSVMVDLQTVANNIVEQIMNDQRVATEEAMQSWGYVDRQVPLAIKLHP
jgi:hypothetical protein